MNDSVLILEKCSRLSRPLKVPTIHSIGSLNEERTEVEHQWENGVEITNDEIICQVIVKCQMKVNRIV